MSSEVIGFLGVIVGALIAGGVTLASTRQKNDELARERAATLERENRERRANFYLDLSIFITYLDVTKAQPPDSDVNALLGKMRVLASRNVQRRFMAFHDAIVNRGDVPAAGRAVQDQMQEELDSSSPRSTPEPA